MIDILIAVGISLTVSILLDPPMLVRLFTRQGFGHEIAKTARQAIRRSAERRRWAAWRSWPASVRATWAPTSPVWLSTARARRPPVCWCCFLATTLGAVGFVDDLIKIRRSRNLGLNKTAKTVGQITAAVLVGRAGLAIPQ